MQNAILTAFKSTVQLLFSHSVVSDFLLPPWTAACQASMSFTISQSLLKLRAIELVVASNHLVLFHSPYPSPLAFNLSQHQGLF